ncbi:hypothetical protein BMETH_2153_0 [methanotrophic bacterial endosymbiont of Bathymodiolus sp.]|nr:hypothetical protein BMETH_2153_0 [methanotrophic bacterial endosymbiont of Bathymodiolus sp.]
MTAYGCYVKLYITAIMYSNELCVVTWQRPVNIKHYLHLQPLELVCTVHNIGAFLYRRASQST